MKTKKLLSLLLAFVMLVSMTVSFGITADAESAGPVESGDMTITLTSTGFVCSNADIQKNTWFFATGDITLVVDNSVENGLIKWTRTDADGEKYSWEDPGCSAASVGNNEVISLPSGRIYQYGNYFYSGAVWNSTLDITEYSPILYFDPVEDDYEGELPDENEVYYRYAQEVVLPSLTKEGYTLLGWRHSITQALYLPGATYTVPFYMSDVDFTAEWEEETNGVYLDLDNSTTDILEKKDLDQNYNLTVNEGTNIDVTKVKLSWEIKDIDATRTDNMVWDTENLCWKTDSSFTTINQQGTAKFTLENYSSVKVDATASFKAEGDFKGTASYDVEGGMVTLDTANGNNTYSKTSVPKAVINATITTADDDFKSLDATTSATKYGTYTVTLSQAKEMVTLTFTSTCTSSKATLTYNGKTYNKDESFEIKVAKNSVVSIVKTGNIGEGPTESTLTVDGKTVSQYSEQGSILAWIPISNGAIITEDMNIATAFCILSGSKVTLADGTTKLIDDVTTEDKLMTFNFYEGKLDGNYPMHVMKHENVTANVITVTLDNGTILEMCDWQQFFDMNKKAYFDIDAVNYKEAIGRNVMFVDNGVVASAKIVNATMEIRTCTSYEIFTEYNKNFVVNGILTVEPETYLQGVYTIGDDLRIDMNQYQQDAEIYGRYTYEEFAHIMTEHEFEIMNIADKKIAVGKGIVSEEWLFELYKEWTPLYR